ncbi:5'-nucleotidase, lipoprotein e(P4) family [Nocardioides maradonensis]
MKRFLSAGLAAAAASVITGFVMAQPASSTDESAGCPVTDYTMALRYQQSASVAALQKQSYRLATDRLEDLVGPMQAYQGNGGRAGLVKRNGHLAVVADLDETVLDNTALLARDLQACHTYTTWDTWSDWEVNGNPTLIPGAAAFFAEADRLGLAVYYISDRFQENKPSTLATLRQLGLPQVSNDHVLLYGPTKAQRRAIVSKDHDIVLELGDSLTDFSQEFKGATAARQQQLVDQYDARWGTSWIAFPDSAYGQWSSNPLHAWDAPLVTS